MQGGINDIAQGRPIEPRRDNLRAMVERGLALGLRVAVCDVLPWNNGWPAQEAPIRALNAPHPCARRCRCCRSTTRSRIRTRRGA